MNLQLMDRAVLVSGGAKGIGSAACRAFVEEGAWVAVLDRDEQTGQRLVDELSASGRAIFIRAELSVEADCRAAVETTVAAFGRLDALINNAGFNDAVGLDQPPSRFLDSLAANLIHVYALTHHAASHLRASHGAIVNVSSKVAVTGQGATSGYAAAKGAINALTREWAVALAPDGVRVNTVLPAECLSDQYQRWFDNQPDPRAAQEAIERLVPLGRRLTVPAEVAAMIVFLASPRSAHTTGQLIFVDGGYTHLDRACTESHAKWSQR